MMASFISLISLTMAWFKLKDEIYVLFLLKLEEVLVHDQEAVVVAVEGFLSQDLELISTKKETERKEVVE